MTAQRLRRTALVPIMDDIRAQVLPTSEDGVAQRNWGDPASRQTALIGGKATAMERGYGTYDGERAESRTVSSHVSALDSGSMATLAALSEGEHVAGSGAGSPPPTKDEVHAFFALAWPTAGSVACRLSVACIELGFLGYLGVLELSQASAAMIWMHASSTWLWMALAGALSALCTQAYAARAFAEMGAALSAAILVGAVLCFVVGGAWLATRPVLQLLSVAPEVVEGAARFAKWSMLALAPELAVWLANVFWQAQLLSRPLLGLAVAFVPVHVALCFVLVHGAFGWAGMGLVGAPLARAVTAAVRLAASIAYFRCSHHRPFLSRAWVGWSLRSITMERVRHLAGTLMLPIAAGSAVEQLQLQVVAAMAIHLGNHALSAHTAMMALLLFFSSEMYGFVKATSVLVGVALSSGRVDAAQRYGRLAMAVSICFGACATNGRYAFRPCPGGLLTQLGPLHVQESSSAPAWCWAGNTSACSSRRMRASVLELLTSAPLYVA